MALWTSSYPVDAGDRDPSFAWHDTDLPSAGLDDSQHDLFAQFLDFEAGHGSTSAAMGAGGSVAAVASEPFYMDHHQAQLPHHHPHHAHHESSTTSSGVSNADDFDFLSTSSNVDAAAGYDVDPSTLAMFAQDPAAMYAATGNGATVSDTELERLEGISLHSPKKGTAAPATDRASSPTPEGNNNNTPAAAAAVSSNATTNNNAGGTVNGRRSRKIVEALSSTIRKATTMRKTRKVSQALQRAVSPSLENPPMALKPANNTQTLRGRRAHTQHALQQQQQQQQFSESPPLLQVDTAVANGGGGFVAGQFDDPFGGEISPTHAPQMRYYSQGGLGTPMDSPTRSAAMLQQQQQGGQHWQQQQQQHSAQWSAASSQQELWWGGAGGGVDAKNIDANMAMHSQHGELPYDVHSDGSMPAQNGLMIHMPQPRQAGINELALNAHTYLPPPPPVPADTAARSARPPRAPSSGARHNRTMSSSPMRKQRAPSASPSPGTRQSRNSSGASAASSSQRSASGRGSVPGTPSGVKKRRSRDAGSGSFSADEGSSGGGGGGGLGGITLGGGIGFVNFTPNDGSVLMTGVAPSGSSKTKARREKEAQERRRRLSEAAMKAVAAAGGDIEKFREQQGFEI